ncbi:copper oxidase, partial [Leclercia adecarboxylata]|nr:copper oxidase [Leclercia adecarboxylata]
TYDVIVTPDNAAYTIFAQSEDRSGFARGTLAPRLGMSAEIPPMDPRALLTMTDMGMGGMAGMDMGGSNTASSGKGQEAMPGMASGDMKMSYMPGMDMGNMPGMSMKSGPATGKTVPDKLVRDVAVDNV